METTAVKLYSTGYREAKTYLAAALFVVSYQGLAHAAEAIGLHDAPWVGQQLLDHPAELVQL